LGSRSENLTTNQRAGAPGEGRGQCNTRRTARAGRTRAEKNNLAATVALTVHAITRFAEDTRLAFELAMRLTIGGVTVAQAEQMFADASRRPQ
jgi:hypothetical protein